MENIYIDDELQTFIGRQNGYYYIIKKKKSTSLYELIFFVSDEKGSIFNFLDDYRMDHPEIGSKYHFDKNKAILKIPLNASVMQNKALLEMIVEAISFELKCEGYVQRCSRSGQIEDLHVYRVEDTIEVLNTNVYENIVLTQNNIKSNTRITGKQTAFTALGFLAGALIYILLERLRFISGFAGVAFFGLSLYGFKKAQGHTTVTRLKVLAGLTALAIVVTELASTVWTIYWNLPEQFKHPMGSALMTVFNFAITDGEVVSIMVLNIGIALVLSILLYGKYLAREINKARRGFLSYQIVFNQAEEI